MVVKNTNSCVDERKMKYKRAADHTARPTETKL